MEYLIREIRKDEIPLLGAFLYEAIFVPEGEEAPPCEIIDDELLQVYIRDFGEHEHDKCFIAELHGKAVGAVWARIMDDYGHIDKKTPSLAISLFSEYRSNGIGTALLRKMLECLKGGGYRAVSLSCQKENRAVGLYQKAGFKVYSENDEEYIMRLEF